MSPRAQSGSLVESILCEGQNCWRRPLATRAACLIDAERYFSAFAQVADGQSLDDFLDTLALRGKARIATRCSIALADGTAACTLEARFVALRSKLAADPAQSTPAPDPARR